MPTPTPAKSPSPTRPPPAPAPKAAPAPSIKQAGGPALKLGAAPASEGAEVAPGVLELKGMGAEFKPPPAIASFLDGRKLATVNARFGGIAAGPMEVETRKGGKYAVKNQRLPLQHPLFGRVAEAAPGLAPCLVVNVRDNALQGKVGLAAGAKLDSVQDQLAKAPEILGLMGFSLTSGIALVNKLEGGSLHFGASGVPIRLGQAFSGTFSLTVVDESIKFEGGADIQVGGLAQGKLQLTRSPEGQVTGKVAVGLNLPKNLSGSVDVAWDGRAITGEGKVGYKGEKLSGEITLRLMEKGEAARLEAERKAPEGAAKAPAAAEGGKAKSKGKVDYAVFGEGDLTFSFTDWLNGTAHVIVDPKGFVTVIGKITPQKEFILFKQKDYERQLFKVEARASYGLPVVGNIFIFANVSMSAFATLGPGKFYNIVVEGTYSTDPQKSQSFSIRGSLNISAAAGLKLRGEAGAGLEILAHDIKAGAGVNGIAGIKGYAEATPIIGYREKAAPGQDKKGEFFIRGELEIAAQPFLGLSGDLFVEVDAPWWSPVPDKRWTWPLFNKEWPIGGSLGVGASVDYVFGSNEWPKLDFKPVEFDSTKFMSDLYSDKAKSGSGKDKESKGKWGEKNSKAADPPPKKPPVGSAKPGKGATPPPAKSKVQPGGGGKGAKPVDPNARTKEGKSVKQLQDEATKKGKKPPGGDVKAGTAKEGAPDKGKDKVQEAEKDKKITAGLDAIDKAEEPLKKGGAIARSDAEKVAAKVKKEHPVFKSIKVVDGGASWDYDYVASPGKTKKGEPQTGKSEKSAIDILWVKPDIANYKKVLLARTIDAANRRKAEIGLKPSERIPRAELDKLPAKDKMTVGPLESTPLEGINVGVTDPFSSEFKIGYSFKARKKETGNARKDEVNKILEKHGYNRTDNLYGAETDGDHVWEKQLGGKDHENNVWPLKSATNQDSGRKVLQERKRIVEQYGLSSLDGIWLRLSTSPAGPGKPGS